MDSACTGMEAFRMLIPDGWNFEGGIQWSIDKVIMPAACSFKVSGDGVTMQALPAQAFFWTSLPQVRLSHPVGSRYLGATVCPVLHAADVIKDLMLPALRQHANGLAIVRESPAADIEGTLGLGSAFKSCGAPSSEGARIRVEYCENGKSYEEDLFCTVTSFTFTIPAGGSDITYVFWIADHMFSFRALKGALERSDGIFQAMVHSFTVNPVWFDMYNRIVLFLKDSQMQRPYSLRQLSTGIDRAVLLNDDAMRSYALRQSAYQRIAGHIGREGSTSEYYDPIQQICVRLPAGYDHAWASDSGEYLLSNCSDVLPDRGFTEIWKIMEPIGLGSPDLEPSTAYVS